MSSERPREAGELLTHVPALDGLRFFAFFAVYIHHAGQNRAATHEITRYGGLGVQVFFVLSGFLIGSILYDLRQRSAVPLRSRLLVFYARRGLRIFPLYYLALFLLLPLPSLGFDMFGIPSDLPWNLAYLSNLRMVLAGRSMGGLSHFWSLSVEEHFYLVAPFLVLTLRLRSLERTCLGVFIGCAVARACFASNYASVEFLSPFQFDCLLFGIAAALLRAEGSFLGVGRRTALRLAVLNAVLAGPLLVAANVASGAARVAALAFGQFTFSWAVAGAILSLWTARDSAFARFLTLRPFVYLGKISYGLYVWHFPVLLVSSILLKGVLSRGSSLIALPLTIAIASLSFYLFERPITNLKRYYVYPDASRSPGLARAV
jgi:peptidoglycan/LPS O-acetylase OafA/YrhL